MQCAKHVANMPSSYIREILSATTENDVISLAGGLPNEQSFPLDLMQYGIKALGSRPQLFQYGETAGYGPLRDFLLRHYKLPASHNSLICTGSQQGLDLVARTFLDEKDGVLLEAPSYLGALQVFSLARARIKCVRQLDNGPDLEQLEDAFINKSIKLFYAVPDFHNPSGICWSLSTRQQVAALCRRYRVTLLEDVPYRELRFSGTSLPLVSSFYPEGSIVLRSFSKTVAPGLRLGFTSAPKQWIDAMIKVKQCADLHSANPMQFLLLSILEHPAYAQHQLTLIQTYAQRYKLMAALLKEHSSNGWSFRAVQGGMFVWLKLPDIDPFEFARKALAQKIAVVPSTVFYTENFSAEAALRLNFTHTTEDRLTDAIRRLSQLTDEMLAN